MTKIDPSAPLWERVTTKARMGSDRKRGLYVAARHLVAPKRAAVRTLVARRTAGDSDLSIPVERGFVVRGPDRFPEAREIVEVARRRLGEVDPQQIRKRGKPFMVPLLDQASLTRESPLIRLALREDVLWAVSVYLRVAPILSSIDVYYSLTGDRELISSQLLHCDGDDTRQVKIFVLCTPVDRSSGPLMIMDTDRSERLRRKLDYEYRNRVTDEQACETLGELALTAVEGEPGTSCFVDTSRCFHYGSRVDAHAEARLVAIIQYLTPYSFMLPRDYRGAARYRHLAVDGSSRLEQLVLGAR